MALCGSVWMSVGQSGSVWGGVIGLMWLALGQFGSLWVSVDQCGWVDMV